ncbi:MAG: BatA and WFA domain-containing protein, partial [Acidobacteria bacterium]|nr:BatA and WFA domain-containing protein [Acidobacteriota bacterium]
MAFLTPLFLAGLAALAIPVLVHLIQRERRNVVEFPSLMFLRRIPYQSVQRRRIRHWVLLLMRLAALALIVAAFARPFLRRGDVGAAAAAGAREVVLLVDRSYSMGYADRWQRALAAARQAINGLGGADRASIVLFSSNAEVAVRSTSDKGRLLAAIGGEPSAAGTRFAPALKLAGTILSESAVPRREAILISDFQRAGWQGSEGVRLPDGASLTTVPISDQATANVAVTPIALERSTFSDQERTAVTAGVVNRGSAPLTAVDLTLEIDGRSVETRRLRLEPNGSASATFAPVTIAARNTRGTVRIGADSLARDNSFHFVVSPGSPVTVVIAQRAGAPGASGLYVSRALAVGDAPRFEVTTREIDALSAADVDAADVVMLNDVSAPPGLADRLSRFAERGGGVFVVLGERAAWPQSTPSLLPAVVEAAVDRARQPARLVALEYGHPIFELFRSPRSGDFSAARFYSYRAVKPAADARVLARFDDGGAALVERPTGSGRVLLWTSTIDLSWNDLAVKPVYLPFIHRLARHLGSYRDPAPWHTVGDVLEPRRAEPGASARSPEGRSVLTPSGQRIP